MKHEDEWRYEGFWLFRIIFRIMFIVFAISIVLWIFSNLSSGMSCQQIFLFPNWGWGFVGLFFFIWFLSWIFRISWYGGYRHEERILRRRYARGEITEAQFKRMMKTLQKHD